MADKSANNQTDKIGGSILDKIISSKEDQARQNFDPQEIVAVLLKKLNNKEAEVLKARFGLQGSQKETLEAIGKRYNVTRERIRQIENLAIQKIKQAPDFKETIKPVEHLLTALLNEYGGIMSETYLLDQLLLSGIKDEAGVRAVLLILSRLLDGYFIKIQPSKQYRLSWRGKITALDFLDSTLEELKKIMIHENQPLTLERLMNLFKQTDYYRENNLRLNEKVVGAYLEVSAMIAKNPFSEYGLNEWGMVKPKRMNDKIKLLMQKEKKPMHFVEIAEKITQIFKKRAYPPTVHNELILNKEYVLVGRGIYALKEWGYKEGVVADIISEVLTQQGPLSREDLVRRVLEQRIVKKNTIHLALTNKLRFAKLADGRYTLVAKQK